MLTFLSCEDYSAGSLFIICGERRKPILEKHGCKRKILKDKKYLEQHQLTKVVVPRSPTENSWLCQFLQDKTTLQAQLCRQVDGVGRNRQVFGRQHFHWVVVDSLPFFISRPTQPIPDRELTKCHRGHRKGPGRQ